MHVEHVAVERDLPDGGVLERLARARAHPRRARLPEGREARPPEGEREERENEDRAAICHAASIAADSYGEQ